MEIIRSENKSTEKEKENEFMAMARKQLFYLRVGAVTNALLFLCLLFAAVRLVPRMETALSQLENTAQSLQSVDWDGFAQSAQGMMEQVPKSIESAVRTLEGIDLEGLNKAIGDLQKTIEPMAKLFGGGR